MKAALLPDRGVVKVAGDDARSFLNGLVTANVTEMTPATPRYGALLTPQGKIIVDCLVAEASAEDGGGFFLDCPLALAGDLVQKLKFYKLRAKVTAEDLSESLGVLAAWDGNGQTECGLVYGDPRLPALGQRVILPPSLAKEAAADLGAELVEDRAYESHRIALGVPRGGFDFIYGDTFPHEANMDQLNGVDFAKGCYVGQEVVSRMEHRGTARNRIVKINTEHNAPDAGIPVMAGDRQVGTTGSSAGNRGLAMLRLDRVADAQAASTPLTAGGVTLSVQRPEWARFAVPGHKDAV